MALCIMTNIEGVYWLLWQGEAETLNPAQSPAGEYEANLTKYCKLIFSHFPNCRVALMTLLMRTSDYGGKGASKDYDLIVAAQIAVASAFPDRVILVDTQVPSRLPMADTVHASAGDGGGYDIGMSRFRDTWLPLDAELVQPSVTPTPDIVSLRSDTAWTGTLHVHSGTSTEMLALADDLKRILLRMTGQSITIDQDTTGAGIPLVTFDEWAPDNYGFPGSIPDYIFQGHDYIVVTEDTMVRIMGVDVTAAEQGVFRLLDLLGYRALLPTDV